MQKQGGVNILSTPNLMTLDNEQASIVVGRTVPFVTGTYTTTGDGASNPFQTVQREDVGLTLRIRPQISEGGTVKLSLYQEVSSIDPSSTLPSATSGGRSEEHTSELQSLMRISYAVFCLKKQKNNHINITHNHKIQLQTYTH